MYDCETWTISKLLQKKQKAIEMRFLRRMLRISCTTKKSNKTVVRETDKTRSLINKKTALKDVGWTNKVAKSITSDRCIERDEG